MPTFETASSGLLWDATALPNAFICHYMPTAPENHVKVYLYGYMCAHGGSPDEGALLEDTARALSLPAEEVQRALRYWECCRLVERISDQPPRYRFLSVQQTLMERRQAPTDEAYEAFAQAVYAAFGERRKLHGGETVLAYEWVEELHLPMEVVLMLIQHMIATRGVHFGFQEAQKVATAMAQQRITSLEDAEAYFGRSEAARRGARKVLNRLGMHRAPSDDEVDLYVKWTREWGFEPKGILAACRETTKGAPTFGYLNKVLEGLYRRCGGGATSESRVMAALESGDEQTMHVREVLNALGLGAAVVDEGMRALYNDMAAVGGHEVVMLAAREVAVHSRSRTLDKVMELLSAWEQKGLQTPQAVKAHLEKVAELDAQIRRLMERAGAKGGTTQANRELLVKWKTQWGVSDELMAFAAECARGASKPMTYINRLLETWREAGATTVQAARAENERRSPAAKAPGKRVQEQMYAQRQYDPAELDGLSPEQLEEMKRL